MEIPTQFTKESGLEDAEFHIKEPVTFVDIDGNKIDVVYQCRYPSSDFIFGQPHKESPKYEKEYAFFQFRKIDPETQKHQGWYIYLDQEELINVIEGFQAILEITIQDREQAWQEFMEKNKFTIHKFKI